MHDPYATLQVPRDASQDDIKRSFRRLAKELHPDLHPNDPRSATRFKEVTEAYDVLSDAAKRRRVDEALNRPKPNLRSRAELSMRSGLDGLRRAAQAARDRARSTGATEAKAGTAGSIAADGEDIQERISLTFPEAALGCRKKLVLPDQRTLDVNIPAGASDGQILRVRGQGMPGSFGGSAGDLLITVTLDTQGPFSRRGNDIYSTIAVTVPEAVLGANVLAPTVHGPVQLQIPRGANTDTVLRLKGKGAPAGTGKHGDHYVTLKVVLPPENDPEFSKLIEVWSRRQPYRVRPL